MLQEVEGKWVPHRIQSVRARRDGRGIGGAKKVYDGEKAFSGELMTLAQLGGKSMELQANYRVA